MVFPAINAATVRVLTAEGFEVVVPPGQGCCGALSAHAGRVDEAHSDFARSLLDCFDVSSVDAVVVNSAGCGSTMKEYGYLLHDDPRFADKAERFSSAVRDFAEFLDERTQIAQYHPLELRVAYHDACHLSHAQGVRDAPRRVLGTIPGLEIFEVPEGEICCGSAGVYNLLQAGPASELGDRKANNVLTTGAQLLVAANPGCSMQIAAAVRAGEVGLQSPIPPRFSMPRSETVHDPSSAGHETSSIGDIRKSPPARRLLKCFESSRELLPRSVCLGNHYQRQRRSARPAR